MTDFFEISYPETWQIENFNHSKPIESIGMYKITNSKKQWLLLFEIPEGNLEVDELMESLIELQINAGKNSSSFDKLSVSSQTNLISRNISGKNVNGKRVTRAYSEKYFSFDISIEAFIIRAENVQLAIGIQYRNLSEYDEKLFERLLESIRIKH